MRLFIRTLSRSTRTSPPILTSQRSTMSSSSAVPALSSSFPSSTASPSRIFRFPGVDPEGTEFVRAVLTENDHKYDIFNRIRYQHNHFPHSILTRYALGASPQLLKDTWAHDEKELISLDPETPERQKSKPPPDESRIPKEITKDNWDDPKYLEYDGAYAKYLAFFHKEIDRLGPIETLKAYVFSPEANWEGRKPQMLSRVHGGFFHPFIHIGFGLEFQDRVLIAEGLAEACIHSAGLFGDLFDPPFPKDIYDSLPSSNGEIATDNLSAWSPEPPMERSANGNSANSNKVTGTTLLEIYADICANPKMAPVKYDPNMLMHDRFVHAVSDGRSSIMKDLAANWRLEKEDLEGVGLEMKVQEVAVLATLLACATGRKGKPAKVDFFLMHALTSSIFIPSYLPHLNLGERKAFLYTYVLTCLSTAVSRGRPHIDLELLMSHTPFPTGPGTLPKSSNGNQVLSNPTKPETQNAWMGVIQSSLFDNDAHVPKAIRSLVHFSALYGSTRPGEVTGAFRSDGSDSNTRTPTLPGADQLDGTLFIRAAGVIMDALGWCREGQKAGGWDMSAMGYDEAW